MPNAPLVSFRGEHAKFPLPLRVLGRYFINGDPLRGPGDNATMFHRATVDYRARPYVKLTAPIWQRLARRHAAFTVPLGLAGATVTGAVPRWALPLYLAAALAAALAWLGRWAVLATRHRRVNKEWIDPAAKVLVSIIGGRYVKRAARRAIDLPLGWGSGAEGDSERGKARVHIPAGTPLSAQLRRKIVENVGARLGIPAPVMGDWRESGADVFVELSAAPVPPAKVSLDSIMAAILKADDTEIVVGRSCGGHIVKLSTSEDTPHFALSGPSGTGKSVMGRLFLSQRLHRGDGVFMLDPKRWSHWRWAGGGKIPIDRLVYAYKTPDVHEAWLGIAAEFERRIELDEDELDRLRRVWICIEEINTMTKRLTRYWKGERKRIMLAAKRAMAEGMDYDEADLDPPLTSPAIVAMQESVGMGRELKMHVVVMAQRLSASVFGGNGGDIRESFQGGRMIARWDRKLWKMLVDTIDYVACPTGPRGIWGLARGEDFTIFRVPYMSDAEATKLATSGAPATGPVLGHQDFTAPVLDDVQDTEAITVGVPLSEALGMLPGQDGPDRLTLDGLRTAVKRAGHPGRVGQNGRAYLYDVDTLVEWRQGMLPTEMAEIE